jgi:hypothetical protein
MPGGQTAAPDLVASYQILDMPVWFEWAVVVGSVGMAIYAAIATLLRDVGYMRFSGLVVLIGMTACMYQAAFVWVRRIDLTTDGVIWHTLARHGRIALDDLACIRNDSKKPTQALFEGRPGTRVRVAANERMRDFLAAVRNQAPHADVSVRLYAFNSRGRLAGPR